MKTSDVLSEEQWATCETTTDASWKMLSEPAIKSYLAAASLGIPLGAAMESQLLQCLARVAISEISLRERRLEQLEKEVNDGQNG